MSAIRSSARWPSHCSGAIANGTNDVGIYASRAGLEDLHVGQLMYDATAAAGYERGFARISLHFIPFLLSAAGISAGHKVLDVATGTGLAAEAALALVGPTGHVTATDISPQMVERARERLKAAPNTTSRSKTVRRLASLRAASMPSLAAWR